MCPRTRSLGEGQATAVPSPGAAGPRHQELVWLGERASRIASPTYWRGNGRHSARSVVPDECEQDELDDVVDPVGPDFHNVVAENVGSGPYPRRSAPFTTTV